MTARWPPRSRRGAPFEAHAVSAETVAALAVALGAGWASGLNAYAAVLVLGAAHRLGLATLPNDLQVLSSPWVMGVAAMVSVL